jgi:hypothetical protein
MAKIRDIYESYQSKCNRKEKNHGPPYRQNDLKDLEEENSVARNG